MHSLVMHRINLMFPTIIGLSSIDFALFHNLSTWNGNINTVFYLSLTHPFDIQSILWVIHNVCTIADLHEIQFSLQNISNCFYSFCFHCNCDIWGFVGCCFQPRGFIYFECFVRRLICLMKKSCIDTKIIHLLILS